MTPSPPLGLGRSSGARVSARAPEGAGVSARAPEGALRPHRACCSGDWSVLSAASSSSLPPGLAVCSPSPPRGPKIGLSTGSALVPAGGDVVAICTLELCTTRSAELVDSDAGTTLPSQVIRQGTDDLGQPWAVLRPTTPLTAGMRVAASLGGTVTAYDVVASEAGEPSANVVHGEVVARATPTGEPVCCEPHPGSCAFDQACFYETKQIAPALTVYPGAEPSASQWLFRITVAAEDMEPKQGAWFPAISNGDVVLDVQRSTYCFTLQAESLKDGTQIQVASECLTNQVELAEWTIPDMDAPWRCSSAVRPRLDTKLNGVRPSAGVATEAPTAGLQTRPYVEPLEKYVTSQWWNPMQVPRIRTQDKTEACSTSIRAMVRCAAWVVLPAEVVCWGRGSCCSAWGCGGAAGCA